jgi:hypothetical protein
MSVADQITRLNTAKADIKTAIESHSITVPSDAHIDTYDDYIKQIGDSTYWTHDWKWKRPTGWPDIDTLYDNSPNYCWMVASFDCRRRIADENVMDGFCFYILDKMGYKTPRCSKLWLRRFLPYTWENASFVVSLSTLDMCSK